jgi:hypothetical protein
LLSRHTLHTATVDVLNAALDLRIPSALGIRIEPLRSQTRLQLGGDFPLGLNRKLFQSRFDFGNRAHVANDAGFMPAGKPSVSASLTTAKQLVCR